MKRKPLTPSDRDTPTTDTTADTAEYVEKWARALVKAGKADARLILADYKTLAANKQLEKADRDIARKRAKAIERIL